MASISTKLPLLLRVSGAITTVAAVLLRRRGARSGAWLPTALAGAGQLAAGTVAGRRAALAPGESLPTAGTTVTGEGPGAQNGRAGVPLAPAPVEAPGPSVTPPRDAGSDLERAEGVDAGLPDAGETASGDDLVAQQESAAAAEAAAIGGRVPSETGDPAMDPVYEAGGGEQEGFEAAEEQLIENATHDAGHGQPERDAFSPELEADRSTAVFGEPDEAEPADQ